MVNLPTICVFGLGAGTLDQMTLSTYKRLKNSNKLYVRTKAHPVMEELELEGLTIHPFDDVYEVHDTFQPVYEAIVERLVSEASSQDEPVLYAVPGHPLVAEETVQRLLEKERQGVIQLQIEGGQSFLDPVFTALRMDPSEGFQLLDATSFTSSDWSLNQHLILTQVYDFFTASNVKLSLMEQLPDDYRVRIVKEAGGAGESVVEMPLYELDRAFQETSNLAVVYVPPVREEMLTRHTFRRLREVIHVLRSPDGCPWDRKQTHQSLKKYLLEEAYEVLEAIDEDDDDHLIEELGDVLLQVMLHSQIGEDEGYFTIDDVIKTLTDKMIRRHPHVFSTATAETSEDVVTNWDEIKKQEKQGKENDQSELTGIPKSMPALMVSYELQKKAAKVGFSWETAAPMWQKLEEEIWEWKEAISEQHDESDIKKELGDVLFIVVNLARFYRLQPEEALQMTNTKFKKRFMHIEKRLLEQGQTMNDVSLEAMDRFWDEAKQLERESEGE
ncbi:nucleoside triphosphate pyrophosphohydrolase [Geomicrobium sediminis]|uniref:nucleoside triphosphate pyrophosphohydrolase n=1 Tax=Geomicrobium sediminis TaxID=1347788 RepID=UPI003B830CEC